MSLRLAELTDTAVSRSHVDSLSDMFQAGADDQWFEDDGLQAADEDLLDACEDDEFGDDECDICECAAYMLARSRCHKSLGVVLLAVR